MNEEGILRKIAVISAMEVELYYVEEFLKERDGWNKIAENVYENQAKNLKIYSKYTGTWNDEIYSILVS